MGGGRVSHATCKSKMLTLWELASIASLALLSWIPRSPPVVKALSLSAPVAARLDPCTFGSAAGRQPEGMA